MSLVLLIILDVALGGIAWRLGKKNEESNRNMEHAVKGMGEAVVEMRRMNDMLIRRMDRLEVRLEVIEEAA